MESTTRGLSEPLYIGLEKCWIQDSSRDGVKGRSKIKDSVTSSDADELIGVVTTEMEQRKETGRVCQKVNSQDVGMKLTLGT